jgi:hypothetical protein
MNSRLAAAVLLLAASCLEAQTQVRVATARELIRAIASDSTVVLAPGKYLLSEVAQTANPAVSWDEVSDGRELVITGLNKLTLHAPQGATLLASPRYAFTLAFVDCHDLVLEGLTIGHTEAGFCTGGVIYFDACTGVRIGRCELFGSGTVGIDATDSSGITVQDSIIRDCTDGALWLTRVQDLRFKKVLISGDGFSPLISIDSSRSVGFETCRILRNTGGGLLWITGDSERVALSDTEIKFNQAESLLWEGSLLPDLSRTLIADNSFSYREEEEYYPDEEPAEEQE